MLPQVKKLFSDSTVFDDDDEEKWWSAILRRLCIFGYVDRLKFWHAFLGQEDFEKFIMCPSVACHIHEQAKSSYNNCLSHSSAPRRLCPDIASITVT